MKAVTPIGCVLLAFLATSVGAATFVVPDDGELLRRTDAVVIGTVEGSFVEESGSGINTVYEVRVERSMKGAASRDSLLRVVSPGGVAGDRAVSVPGSAHFDAGERVLLLLQRTGARWRTAELTLGKFRFTTSSRGTQLLLRDAEEIVGWDVSGRPHKEKVRRAAEFIRFVEESVSGLTPSASYFADSSEVVIEPSSSDRLRAAVDATYRAGSYTSHVSDGTSLLPSRWQNIASGVTFLKRVDQNISGVPDGGVSVIQNALAAWNNECGSVINLIYGGTTATASANFDTVHVIEFNDPQGRVPGTWTGSGTIAIAFNSFNNPHDFAGESWWTITDADVVFQNGFPGTHPAFGTAMTHEVGHGIGWRHSNAHFATSNGSDTACDPNVEECSSNAIMNATTNSSFGYTLQSWDINAARAVYPGTCGPACIAPMIVTQPSGSTIAAGASTTLSVTAAGTGLSYQWYLGAPGNFSSPVPGGNGPSVSVSPGTTSTYFVRITGSCGTVNSNAATVTVTVTQPAAATASRLYLVTPCRVIDTRSPAGPYGGPELGSGAVRAITFAGRCGIPVGAKAVVANVTAVSPFSTGYLTVYPGTGSGPAGSSTLNYRSARTLANNAIARLSSDGKVSVYNGGTHAVHFLIDVNGYFQ